MSKNIQIIPSILATSEEQYSQDLSKLEKSESLQGNWVHIDFADNIFVRNRTIDPEIVQKFPTNLRKEAHLMIHHPGPSLGRYIQQGFERIILHVESDNNSGHDDLLDNLHYIEDSLMESGLAIKFNTSTERLIPYLKAIDVVIIMSIEPGFQGQPFIKESLDKIKQVVELRNKHNPHVRIGVDGSVKDSNIREIANAGADFVIVGSYLLQGDIDENLEKLWEVLRLRSG